MEDETVQPTRISKEEYQRFKQWVQDVHGKTRGHLSTEIENALREYRQPDNGKDSLARIEDNVATIMAHIAETESDGGSVVHTEDSANSRTHAEGKPAPNSPRKDKVDWLVSQYDESGSTTAEEIKERVTDEFGFEERTAEEYVQPVIDTLDVKKHPNNPKVFLWGDKIEEVRESIEEESEQEFQELMNYETE